MPDFWRTSGWHLLDQDAEGRLVPTPAFLAAYFRRPELEPPPEACDAERALHAALLDDPMRPVEPAALDAIADPDAKDNWRVVLDFRDRLLAAGTLEACYLAAFRTRPVQLAPLFLGQMAHAILRQILEGVRDPYQPRAAELLFRSQKMTLREGSILLADEETLETVRSTGGFGSLGRLVAQAETPLVQVEMDVLQPSTVQMYWERSDLFDTVLDLAFTRPGLDALCRVLEKWLAHFLGVAVRIQPVQQIRDERWSWHVGLDAEASRLLDDLWHGREVDEERIGRILSLFRLEITDPGVMLERIAGRPVYMALCATPSGTVRTKPQNLLMNLPLKATN